MNFSPATFDRHLFGRPPNESSDLLFSLGNVSISCTYDMLVLVMLVLVMLVLVMLVLVMLVLVMLVLVMLVTLGILRYAGHY
jgi:hypothetical protein